MKSVTIGRMLHDARVKAGLTMRDIQKQVDISAGYLCDLEYDRRIPSEDVIRRLSIALELDFDVLMARAGRIGDAAERYLVQHPTAGILLRRCAELRLSEEDLRHLLGQVECFATLIPSPNVARKAAREDSSPARGSAREAKR